MWFFKVPNIVYGDDALSYLATLPARRVFVVTDPNIVRLGILSQVRSRLEQGRIGVEVFADVEPDPCLETVTRAAEQARSFAPDWVIGLGGGSSMDTAKMVRILADRTHLTSYDVNPIEDLALSGRVKLCTIPTTSGTGAEVGWACVITDRAEQRKLVLGSREAFPDLAIVDPALAAGMPAQLTADTGMDALVHAIEVYTGRWHNDFVDGPALQAAGLVFEFLPRAVDDGANTEARERLHNAATLAGFGLGNANAGLAHALAHSLGGVFHPPHGRTTSVFLPYTMQYAIREAPKRYADIARWVGLGGRSPMEQAEALIDAVCRLQARIGHPRDVRGLGVDEAAFERHLDHLVDSAEADATMITSARIPSLSEVRRLFEYAYRGQEVDF